MTDRIGAQAARAIAQATSIHIHTGAGMGVDSGLPDFRGPQGFWRAYPKAKERGLQFEELANPRWFEEDPTLAWGFYGHRLNSYRTTQPHVGFQILNTWCNSRNALVFTSNVDGSHQASGFTGPILEIHGSLRHLQCTQPCCDDIWSANDVQLTVDDNLDAHGTLPTCPHCGAMARPNVLMFGDGWFVGKRTDHQSQVYQQAIEDQDLSKAVVIEMGAGTAIPSVRHQSERVQRLGGTLIRINPREAHGPTGTLSLAMGAASALLELDHALQSQGL